MAAEAAERPLALTRWILVATFCFLSSLRALVEFVDVVSEATVLKTSVYKVDGLARPSSIEMTALSEDVFK